MVIAHICLQCGLDLARIRVSRDPHYGLPLVVCPRCSTACVRRRHLIEQGWRTTRRLIRSLLALGGQLLAVVIIGSAMSSAALGLDRAMMRHDLNWLLEEERVLLIFALLVIPIINGAWLSATTRHWRRGAAWTAWLLALVLIGWFVIPMMDWLDRWSRSPTMPTPPWSLPTWSQGLLPLLIMSVISLIGWPIGNAVRGISRANRRQRWRKRRRRMVRQRRER